MSPSDTSSSERRQQSWNAEHYQTHAGFVPTLGEPVVDLLAPKPGERILDLGCGDGVLTERLKALGADVLGVDSSDDMIAAACSKGLDARRVDGEQLDFTEMFDAVFSNAALHWMLKPDAVIAGVAKALKPGGRFVGEFGGHGNVAAITVALVTILNKHGVDGAAAIPWYFPTPAAYRKKLEDHGFEVSSIELLPRPTPLPTDIAGWLRVMAGPFLARVSADDREKALIAVQDLLRPVLCDEEGQWTADYMRLRFAAKLMGTSVMPTPAKEEH